MAANDRASRLSPAFIAALSTLVAVGCSSSDPVVDLQELPSSERSPTSLCSELSPPVRLTADGEPIDIGTLSRSAHAGPWVADVDQDGDRDLVVGDFPGYFWLFTNEATDAAPKYSSAVKLQAGGGDAKTPVY